MPTLSGQSNNYAFLYQGMEHEFTEPNQFYYGRDGHFYSAQIQRGFSIAGAQSTSGPGGAGPRRPFKNALRVVPGCLTRRAPVIGARSDRIARKRLVPSQPPRK